MLTEATGVRWWPAIDGDADALRLMARHYSWNRYADGRERRLFVGPGYKTVLVTADGLAVFVWRKFIDDCPLGGGVNCAAFRNEGPYLSSSLSLEAEGVAWAKFPGERLYTYVDPGEVKSTNPGYCFKVAGWHFCGVTASGLHVLEKLSRQPLAVGGAGLAEGQVDRDGEALVAGLDRVGAAGLQVDVHDPARLVGRAVAGELPPLLDAAKADVAGGGRRSWI